MQVKDYMKLPYIMQVSWDNEGGCWAVEFPELPGLIAANETWGGLLDSINDAKEAWFEAMLEENLPIPEPKIKD